MEWVLWLAVALLLMVVEVVVVDLVFVMFAGGALAAMIVALLGGPIWAQVLAFCAVSAVLLVAVRPWGLRLLRKTPSTATNVAAHVGRNAVVVLDVTAQAGRVKLAGEVWTARSAQPQMVLPVGAAVRVVRIEGATAVVEPIAPSES